MPNKKCDYEVIIIGGGPAGLNAALVLGRCLRKVLICDDQQYRNAASSLMHGYLTRDGISPKEFRKIAHRELAKYSSIEHIFKRVSKIKKIKNYFKVFANHKIYTCRKILLAIGREDCLPDIPDIETFYGKSAFHCPYCDGFEWQDTRIAVVGTGKKGCDYALALSQWSKDIIFCTNGKRLMPALKSKLKDNGIEYNEERILQLQGKRGQLRHIIFSNSQIERDVIFFNHQSVCRSDLIEELGCNLEKDDSIPHDELCIRGSEGIYVAGDACNNVFQAISSAGQGVEAAIYINQALTTEDLK